MLQLLSIHTEGTCVIPLEPERVNTILECPSPNPADGEQVVPDSFLPQSYVAPSLRWTVGSIRRSSSRTLHGQRQGPSTSYLTQNDPITGIILRSIARKVGGGLLGGGASAVCHPLDSFTPGCPACPQLQQQLVLIS